MLGNRDHSEWLLEREQLLDEIRRLKEENAALKNLVKHDASSVAVIKEHQAQLLTAMRRLSAQEKVALFRSFFRGRDDVFPKRWFSKTSGKGGYQPVCTREWNPQFCDKRKYKCADCPSRDFAPLDYNAVFNHLAGRDEYGRDVIGVYAITEDNKCHFVCADFDDKSCEHGYKDDVLAYCSVCKEWQVPASVERSRSGNGAHVWIFFEEPIAAAKARRLGYCILTEATSRCGKMSFKSYDRFIPNQDFLPEGGFGNLIALPLQGKARKEGNSVFVDENFVPYNDQWEYLLSIRKLSEEAVDKIVALHSVEQETMGKMSKSTESKPWDTPTPQNITPSDLPQSVNITKANTLYIPLNGLSAKVVNHLKRIASFKNPEFFSRQAMRLPTFNVPRIICCAEMDDEYIMLPRGCEDAVVSLFGQSNVTVNITDETNTGKHIRVEFNGQLRPEQSAAVQSMLEYNNGVLSATTAFGKTVTAAALIAERKVNTLILVHTKALLEQWKERLETFLDIDYKEEKPTPKRGRWKTWSPIGTLSSSNDSLHGIIDIATMQSCLSDDGVKPFVRDYGMVIVDECHHVSSVCFETVLKYANAHYVYGLTATPMRKDGHQPIIFMQCGLIRYMADARQLILSQSFARILVPRYTSFRMLTDDKLTFTQMSHLLAEDRLRNEQIVGDISDAIDAGRTPIVLTSLTSHVETLATILQQLDYNVITLVGSESAKEKRLRMERLKSIADNERLVIVATGKYVGEGFDFARLDTLFLAMPVSWKGIVTQYAGRLHREHKDKTEVRIYDYVDLRVQVCENMFKRRLHSYKSMGYAIANKPADAESADASGIFSGSDFSIQFVPDIQYAKKNIIISCPCIKIKQPNNITKILQEKVHEGLDVIVFTRDDTTLNNIGIDTKIIESLNLSCAIIDKKTIWYGNANFVNLCARMEDETIRFCDVNIANDFLDFLYSKIK